jgi:hypothetical protein
VRCWGRFPVRSEVQAQSRLAPIESAPTIGGLALTNPPEQPQEPRAQDRQAGWLGNRWWWQRWRRARHPLGRPPLSGRAWRLCHAAALFNAA